MFENNVLARLHRSSIFTEVSNSSSALDGWMDVKLMPISERGVGAEYYVWFEKNGNHANHHAVCKGKQRTLTR